MSDPLAAGLKDQFREIEARLAAAQDPAGREEVKREIIALFKRVDGALTELGQLKDGIRGLVERYKQMTSAVSPPPERSGSGTAVHGREAGG